MTSDPGPKGGVLALFDFDKTLVSRDSFRLFGDLAARSQFERGRLFVDAAMAKLGWIDNAQYKVRVLERVWHPRSLDERKALLERHAAALGDLAIDAVWARLRAHLDAGDRLAVLSASPDFYLTPYLAAVSPAIEVHASVLHEEPTGLRIDNLFREAKATRAAEIKRRIQPNHTVVYTDHRDDIPLMRLADAIVLVRPFEDTLQWVRDAGTPFEVVS